MALINGRGKVLSALTTVPVEIVLNADNKHFFANTVSIFNKGGFDIVARANDNTAGLVATSGDSIRIPAGDEFTFDGNGFTPLMRVVMAAVSGSCYVYVAAF